LLWHLKQSNRANKTMVRYEPHFGLILLGLIAFSFLLGLLFFRPKYGLFLVLFSRPILDNINVLRTYMLPGIGMNTLQMIGVAVSCSMVFICLIKKCDLASNPVNFFRHPLLNTYFLFLLFCLPSLAIADKPFLAMGEWLRLFTLWAVIVFTDFALESEKDINMLIKVVLLSSVYPLVRLSLDLFSGTWVVVGGVSRILGGYFHMSILSVMLLMFLPSYLYFYYNDITIKKKVLMASGIALILIFIYLTHYRTALLGLAAILLAFLIFRKKYTLLMLLVVVIAGCIIFVPSITERFTTLFTVFTNLHVLFDAKTAKYDYLLTSRFGIWRMIITTFLYKSDLSNILFGYGYNPYIRHIILFGHNDLLTLIFQYGCVAPVLFVLFLFRVLKIGFQHITALLPQIVTSLIIALIVASMAHGTFIDVRNLLFLGAYIGMLMKYIEVTRQNNKQPASLYVYDK